MKNNNQMIALVLGVLIFAIVGYFAFTQLGPKSITQLKPANVEKINPIEASYSSDALDRMSDQSKTKDFYVQPDLHNGLGVNDLFATIK
jgi:flagellar basal body-associated protein FliL